MQDKVQQIRTDHIETVRRFNRFYTNVLGLLRDTIYAPEATLTEARVLWEIAYAPDCTATDLTQLLRIDRGYLSRLLDRFVRRGIVARAPGQRDRRQKTLALTARGRTLLDSLEARSKASVTGLLESLDDNERAELVWAMGRIGTILEGAGQCPRGNVEPLAPSDPNPQK